MCGICGIVHLDRSEEVDGEVLASMTASLAHRGPNDAGWFVGDGVGLGHRRLSIIDLAGGRQPIFNEDRSAVIVFNGEIYNFAELRTDLIDLGHRFATRSDTETILHAYEELGDACVERLRGMFAFAIWDRRRRRLFAARDRLGKKPLYYHQGRHFFAFASEIKALLEIPSVPREVDSEALDLYLSLRYVPGPRTMFRGIWKLQPGHSLVFEDGRVRIACYWDVDYRREPERTASSYLEEFRALLDESVRMRMISEVPLGVFLSGGIDSSAILSSMAGSSRERVKAFSIGYAAGREGEEEANEFDYARQAASAFDADHHELRLSSADFRDFIPKLVWHLDEPLADPSTIPLYFIARLAREHITVVLSGEGADELLAGYGIYRRMLQLEAVHKVPIAAWCAPRLARLAPQALVRSLLLQAGLPLEARYRGVSRGLSPGLKARLLPRSRSAAESALRALFQPYFKAVEGASPLDRMLYLDTKIWLPDDLLLKADKMTMATALELRVPFLDHRLVEFAARLPERLKLNGSQGKFLLREAMRGVLPASILERSKKGFPVPTRSWFGGDLRSFAREALLGSGSACRTYLEPSGVAEVVAASERGRRHASDDLWTLLVFEFWHRVFIERRLGPVASRGPKTPAGDLVAGRAA